MTGMTSEPKVTLREITEETVREICDLSVAEEQKSFVQPNSVSIAEAYFSEGKAWFRAIYADETPVGFAMVIIDPENDWYYLMRFMVDHRYQGMGFGRRASTKAKVLKTSYRQGEGGPSGFYSRLGFRETEMTEWGEMGMELEL
jgi:diamine N-acetyltransferase